MQRTIISLPLTPYLLMRQHVVSNTGIESYLISILTPLVLIRERIFDPRNHKASLARLPNISFSEMYQL